MVDGSEYEAVRLLAVALSERDHGEHERAIASLKRVVAVCEGSRTGTCKYLRRVAFITLYGIYVAQERGEEAAWCRRQAAKLGVKKEELEKV